MKTHDQSMPEYLPTARACRVLGVSPNTIRDWADRGLIKCVRTEGGHRRYDVRGWLAKQAAAQAEKAA